MTEQILTVKCKLCPTNAQAEEIEDTLKAFADACNWINQNTSPSISNHVRIHGIVYKDVRAKFGLSANLAVRAIGRVAKNRKAAVMVGSCIKEFKPTSIEYDVRIFSFKEADESVGLTLLRTRQNIKLSIGNYQRRLLSGSNPTSASLCKIGSLYFIDIQVKSEAPEEIKTDKVLGVDLGITDIAVTSEGQKFDGKTIRLIKNHYASMRAVLQQKAVKGTRSSRRRCRELQRRLSGKESRYQRQINHEISKSIVTRAKEIPAKIVLEDLSGIRNRVNPKRGKNQRRQVNEWAFFQLKEFLVYKAMQSGVPMVLVNPAYTSQTCHICGKQGTRKGKKFRCSECGWSGDADFNGAKNIALMGRCVVRPRGSGELSNKNIYHSGLPEVHLIKSNG